MGLHLNYELRLPETKSADDADRVLAALHAYAVTLPFDDISAPTTIARSSRGEKRPKGWLALFASIISKPYEEDIPSLTGDEDTARGFLVNAGEGCESAPFGFLLRGDEAGSVREWFWHACCKTQYASTVSDDHLIKCHTSLVALLDHAITLGVDVVVRDETHYWETRDEQVLVREVAAMNTIVARFAGRFADVIGGEQDVIAPIFAHPRFERLEMGDE